MPLLAERTLELFGYSLDTITSGMAKKVAYQCAGCGGEFTIIMKNINPKHLCRKCAYKEVPRENYAKGIAKRRQTYLAQNGTTDRIRTAEEKVVRRATNMAKFGGPAPMCSEEVQAKASATSMARFGTPYSCMAPASRERAEGTMFERYGVRYSRQSPVLQAKAVATLRESYGVDNPSRSPALLDKVIATKLERYGTLTPQNYGAAETEVADFIRSLSLDVETQVRLPNSRKSLDCYVPSRKVAVEYCGLYFHNELRLPDKQAHRLKFDLAAAAGMQLITLFEDEWIHRRPQVTGRLRSILRAPGLTPLMARKCRVAPLDTDSAEIFLRDNHIQGAVSAVKSAWGLYAPDDDLIGVAALKHYMGAKSLNTIVLQRLCFKIGIVVAGGAGRLLSAVINWARENGYASITSWSDNRWSTGRVYTATGFELVHENRTDYSYVDLARHLRLSKQSQQKQKTTCPPGLTELMWATQRGLIRIWDCGHKRWELTL